MQTKMRLHKMISLLLCFVMVVGMFPLTSYADAAGQAHTHDKACGYLEAVEGHPCEHAHDETCGYTDPAPEIPCDMDCVDSDGDGIIDHTEQCAYSPASEGTLCQHEHDEACGYVEAVEGHPCEYKGNNDKETDADDNGIEDDENPDIGNIGISADSAAGLQFDEADTPAVLTLLGTENNSNTAALAGDSWSFELYYVNYSNVLATTKNGTTLDLIGNDVPIMQTVKYQFEFHNSIDYEAGDVSIILPRALYIDRHGDAVNPSDIGVPMAPAESKASSFNYTIETINGIECLVFTNYKKIISGSNNLIQVFYHVDDMQTVDGTSWDIHAQIRISGQEVEADTVLHGSMDTDTSLYLTEKNAYAPYDSNIYPELYTWNQVKSWSNLSGEEPEDFNDYRYVLWRTDIQGDANQPWTLSVTDTPSHDGEVIGQTLYSYWDYPSSGPFAAYDSGQFTLGPAERYGLSDNHHEHIYLYTLVRYPLSSFPEDQKISNHIEVTLTGVDDQIPHILTSDAEHTWEDYSWTYAGDLFSVDKGYNNIIHFDLPVEEAWIDAYTNASKQGADLPLPENWEVRGYARGYSYVQENASGSYTFNLLDDAQYIKSNTGEYTRLTPKDYHYGSVVFQSTERNIDIYEDKTVPATDGSSYTIYVMTADNPETWQQVAEVPFNQFDGYELGEEWIERGVYSVKVRHEVACYDTEIHINGTTVLHHDSEFLQQLVADETNTQLDVMNIAGGYAEANGVLLLSSNSYGSISEGAVSRELATQDMENYGGYLYRSSDVVRLTRLIGKNDLQKRVKYINNPVLSRVDLTYTISGYDGYAVYSQDAVDAFKADGLSPARKSVTIYDLLPLGVVFDPSKPVTAGQLRTIDSMAESKAWIIDNISVDWSVTDDYRGSGRQMVTFIIAYTDAGEENARYESLRDLWYCGWGVQFGAYYSWNDYALANSGINVAALATDTPIKGEGYIDTGEGVPESAGKDETGKSFFYDPEGDGLADAPYLIYAQVANNDDVAVAAKASIEKLVKENGDVYGEPAQDATVHLGGKYTYTLSVNNAQGKLKNIVVYDRLESGRIDHLNSDPRIFEDSDWHGTFAGVNTLAARMKGASPVVYYSADSTQEFSLSAEGWVEASLWTGDIADVKAVAVDLSKNSFGEDFILDELETIKFSITMDAPDTMQEATYAYNVPAFDSVSIAADGNESTEAGVMGNSTAVRLYEPTSLTVEKNITENANAPEDQRFEFTVTIDGQPYSNKEYRYIGSDGKALPGVYATDENGIFHLRANEKAIFNSVPAGAEYSVKESYMANWRPNPADTITGNLIVNENTVASFTNTYVYPLYFKKLVEFEQDYSNGNDTEFTFVLKLNGQPASSVPYALVDPDAPISNEPEVLQKGFMTGDDGSFKIKAGQRVVFTVDQGTKYSFEEINIPGDYTCKEKVVSGEMTGLYAQAIITNQYRYKDLYVTKTIEALDGITVDANAGFNFTLKLDGETKAVNYILYEKQLNDTTGLVEYQQISEGVTGEDGAFTLKTGQQIRFIRVPAGTSYEITENDDPNDLFKVTSPAGGSASGKIPTYAPSTEEEFVNSSLLRTLEVTKTVLSKKDVSNVDFTFVLMLNGQAAADAPYLLKTEGADDQNLTTDANGKFTLTPKQRAIFTGLTAGTEYIVHEIPTSGYVQIVPTNNSDASGTLPTEMKNEQVSFVNQDNNEQGLLVINKKVISDDPRLAEASLYGVTYNQGSKTFTYGEGWKYLFHVEVNGTAYANSDITRIDAKGNIISERTDADGDFTIRATDTVVIDALSQGDTYSVSEYDQDIWNRLYLYDPDTGESLSRHDVKYVQIDPANYEDVTGTISTDISRVQITNKLYPVIELNIEKAVNNIDGYGDGYGEIQGKIVFRLQLRDKNGNIITGPDTYYYQQYGGDYDQNCRPDENGYFDMWIDTTEELAETSDIYYGEIDGWIPAGYDIKIEEVRAEPENFFGTFTGIQVFGDYTIDEDGFIIIPDNEDYLWIAFENTSHTEKFKVQKDISSADIASRDTEFEFTLYASEPCVVSRIWDSSIRNYVNIYKPGAYNPLPDEPYALFDAASGKKVGLGRTDANGRFTLQAGQYAEFDGKYADDMNGYYEFTNDEAQIHYKIVETPYSNYTPQVTIDKNGTQTVIPGSNSGIILAGQNINFLNAHNNTASLVVTKEVSARSGITIPSSDEFKFTLKVDGKAYSVEEYRRFDSSGNEIFNVQTINGIETTLPWTTSRFGEFTLKNGERVVFDWVGEGRQYEITEAKKDGYTQITPAAGTGISDVITAEGSVAAFVNLYDKPTPSEGTSLTIRKLVALPKGVTEAPDENFTFRIRIDGEAYAMKSYALYNSDGSVINTELNTDFNGELTIKGNQYAILKNIPLNKDFEVEEVLANGTLYTPIGAQKVAGATTVNGAEATFTNAFGNLLVTKQVINSSSLIAPADDEFSFTITTAGKPLASTAYWLIGSEGNKIGEGVTDEKGVFTLKNGETAMFYGLASGSKYSISETGKRYYTQTIPVSQDGYTGTIDETADKLVFVNDYSRLATLEISKTVTGGKADDTQAFTFQVNIGGMEYANRPYSVYGADGYKKAGIFTTTADGMVTLLNGECAVLSGVMPGAVYSVTEVNIPDGYAPEKETIRGIVGTNGSVAAFVNQKSQNDDTVSVTVTKVWKDNNSVSRPDSVSVQLYKDGVAYGDAVTLDARSHWSYTWNDLDSELTWTVDEVNVPSGYTKTVSHRANDWTITNEKNGNTPTPPVPGKDTGNLIVSKVVAGNAGSQTIAFHFTVTLNDTSINGTFGNMTFEDGVAMFTLKHGEQKTASALPAGVRYTVTETEANQDGYTTTVTGQTGMVVASKTVAAAFTNTKNVGSDGEGSNDDNEYGNLTVSKTVTGKAGDFDQMFTFTIKLDCSISGKYGDMHFNKGAAVITLKHGESSTATKLPAGTHYTVTESDNDGYTVTAVGDTGVIRDGKTAVAAFTNHKDTTPVTPNDPTPPTPDPTNPIEPATPDEPSNPGNPTDPTQPIDPATPDEPSNPENPTDPTQPIDPVPQTGDETNIGLWFTLMLCSFVAFVGICIYERKHRYSGRHVRRRNNE